MQIHVLDLNYQNVPLATAAFLVVGAEGPVLIETGPGSTRAHLQRQLAAHGVVPRDIRHVLVTHIHLDHAGAAGWWGQQGAKIYVHHIGAPHLIDPSRLISSATRIYGDQMDLLWGEILPAPAENVIPVFEGDRIEVAGLSFKAMDTPGHARHHHVYQLGDIAFTGDAAGIQLPGSGIVDIPAPPPEFDLEAWRTTVARLEEGRYQAIYLTHFGRVEQVRQHLSAFHELLTTAASFVREQLRAGLKRDAIVKEYEKWVHSRARQAGASEYVIRQYETANPLYMSVDGILRYWLKKR